MHLNSLHQEDILSFFILQIGFYLMLISVAFWLFVLKKNQSSEIDKYPKGTQLLR